MSELVVGSIAGLASNSYEVGIASGSTLDLANAKAGSLPHSALPEGIPFRMAANTVTVNGVTTVTFPSGRFTQTPMVTATPYFAGAAAGAFFTSRTSKSATSVNLYNVTNTGSLVLTDQTVDYIAVQMTSGSGGG